MVRKNDTAKQKPTKDQRALSSRHSNGAAGSGGVKGKSVGREIPDSG